MTKTFIALLMSLFILILTGTSVLAREGTNINEELDGSIREIVDSQKVKGAVLAVIGDGNSEFIKGYGYADEYNDIPADGEKTAFRIGSISKTFVAVTALKLCQEGSLDMKADISSYLSKDFPRFKYPITMHQLLTHTAGFEDRVTGIAVFNVSDTEPLSTSVRRHMPAQVFKPGEIVSYSNYGIALAALVVESVSGMNFADYCQSNIFEPLDMKRTTFKHMQDITYVSKAYTPLGRETIEPFMNLYPEGSAVSTAEDMAKYMKWLISDDDRILSKEYKDQLFEKQFSMLDDYSGIGYTWNRKIRNGYIYFDKKGETLNFYSRIALYPEKNTAVFLSFNTYLEESEINALMNKGTNILHGKGSMNNKYSGMVRNNISGNYVNNWSSFTTPEKIINYVMPGKIIKISGSIEKGFYMNGEELEQIGEDTYDTPIGVLKFLNEDGKTVIATESAITYSKIPVWESTLVQSAVIIVFILFVALCLLVEIYIFRIGKSDKYRSLILVCSGFQLLAFIALVLLVYMGLASFSLLNFLTYMRCCGWLIISTTLVGILCSFYLNLRHNRLIPITIIWNLASIIFCIWLSVLNFI